MDWWVTNRFIIYLVGIILWLTLSVTLPTLVGQPLSIGSVPFTSVISPLLLVPNLVSTLLRADEYKIPPFTNATSGSDENVARYKSETKRIEFIQRTGSYVILPASVIAGITATHSTRLLLLFLGASITTGVVALVPIWMSTKDFRGIVILRHIKTVMLIWATTWLLEGVVALLSINLPPA